MKPAQQSIRKARAPIDQHKQLGMWLTVRLHFYPMLVVYRRKRRSLYSFAKTKLGTILCPYVYIDCIYIYIYTYILIYIYKYDMI